MKERLPPHTQQSKSVSGNLHSAITNRVGRVEEGSTWVHIINALANITLGGGKLKVDNSYLGERTRTHWINITL